MGHSQVLLLDNLTVAMSGQLHTETEDNRSLLYAQAHVDWNITSYKDPAASLKYQSLVSLAISTTNLILHAIQACQLLYKKWSTLHDVFVNLTFTGMPLKA